MTSASVRVAGADGGPVWDLGSTDRTWERSHGAATEPTVAVEAAPMPMVQATGPSGVQPKNWLTPGVWTIAARAAIDATVETTTTGLRPPATTVWPNSVPTRATRPTVRALVAVPVDRAISHPPLAPTAVVTARRAIWLRSAAPSEASGPSCSSFSGEVRRGGAGRSPSPATGR